MTLSPPWYGPPALGCTAAFLAFLGQSALFAGGVELGLKKAVGYWIAAATAAIGAAWLFLNRRALELTVWAGGFRFGGVELPRERVAGVCRIKDLLVNGVRVELEDGTCLGIQAEHHDPETVLSAFRDNGYPVRE